VRHDVRVPWLPMYLLDEDVDLVLAHIDEDPELAWAGHR
jgi:hypothetical protein